jgi:hypothetical protein
MLYLSPFHLSPYFYPFDYELAANLMTITVVPSIAFTKAIALDLKPLKLNDVQLTWKADTVREPIEPETMLLIVA